MYVYCTSKNFGPESNIPPKVLYLGTSVKAAEEAVGDFEKYYREEPEFPRRFPESYSAIPRDVVHWEMIQYYSADGWWVSIVIFELKADTEVPKYYSDDDAKKDFAKIIAQVTSGITGAIPEEEDFDLASGFLVMLNLMRR